MVAETKMYIKIYIIINVYIWALKNSTLQRWNEIDQVQQKFKELKVLGNYMCNRQEDN